MNQQFSKRLYTSPSRQPSGYKPRFQRNSPSSNKSSPSKSAELSPIHQTFIKIEKISKAQLDPDEFFMGFSEQLVANQQANQDQKAAKKYSRNRQNSMVKIQTLQTSLSKFQKQNGKLRTENQRFKQALDKEIEKRRYAEKCLKNNILQLADYQKKTHQYEVTLTSLKKQIKYLQETNWTKTQKMVFSFREKGLIEELRRVKNEKINSYNANLLFLDNQIRRLEEENKEVRLQNKHLRLVHRTIYVKLAHFQRQLQLALKVQQQLESLRQKYSHLVKLERTERMELQQLKKLYHKTEIQDDSLTVSSTSHNSLHYENKYPIKTKTHKRHRPNGS